MDAKVRTAGRVVILVRVARTAGRGCDFDLDVASGLWAEDVALWERGNRVGFQSMGITVIESLVGQGLAFAFAFAVAFVVAFVFRFFVFRFPPKARRRERWQVSGKLYYPDILLRLYEKLYSR